MDIRRGIIRTFDSGTYLADVQIVGSMATVLTGVPVAKQIGADLLTSGIRCGVLFFDETNPSDACVVFVYEGTPVPWITSALIKDGEVAEADLAFDPATQAELDAHAPSTTSVHGFDASQDFNPPGDIILASGKGLKSADIGGTHTIQALGSIFIPAMAFDITRGSPSRGTLGVDVWGKMATWLFDDTVDEGVGTQLVVPTTGDVEIKYYYAMESATSGVVRTTLGVHAIADGEDASATGTPYSVNSTVPGTAKYLKIVTMATSFSVTAGDLLRLSVNRRGAHADDTATGDLHFLGLGIRYV